VSGQLQAAATLPQGFGEDITLLCSPNHTVRSTCKNFLNFPNAPALGENSYNCHLQTFLKSLNLEHSPLTVSQSLHQATNKTAPESTISGLLQICIFTALFDSFHSAHSILNLVWPFLFDG
jgi:hypothetical protein